MDKPKSKKEQAIEFINWLRTTDPKILNALVVREAGENLCQFFLQYAARLIKNNPIDEAIKCTSTFMLLGYLIRATESKEAARDFINRVAGMSHNELSSLIVLEAGNELTNFFISYSVHLLEKDQTRLVENASSLMLMGYLFRAHERKNNFSFNMPPAQA